MTTSHLYTRCRQNHYHVQIQWNRSNAQLRRTHHEGPNPNRREGRLAQGARGIPPKIQPEARPRPGGQDAS